MPEVQPNHFKTLFLSIALFIESFMLTVFLKDLSMSDNYFTPDLNDIIKISIMLLLIANTYALTVGGWYGRAQYSAIPLPISLGIFVVAITMNIQFRIMYLVIPFLFLIPFIASSKSIMDAMTEFKPTIVLRPSVKPLLTVFALVAAAFVLSNPASLETVDIGDTVATNAVNQIDIFLSSDPQLELLANYEYFGVDVHGTISNQINNLVDPYRQYVAPLVALLTLGFLLILNIVIYAIFSLTIHPVIKVARATGFLRVDIVQAEKEVLKF